MYQSFSSDTEVNMTLQNNSQLINCGKATLNPAEAAELLGVNAHTLAVWRSTSRYDLPYIKIGRKIRYRVSDLENWLQHRTRFHTGQTGKEIG